MAMNVRETDKFLEGKAEGIAEGKLEDAIMIVQKYNISPEQVAIDTGIPFIKLQEALK